MSLIKSILLILPPKLKILKRHIVYLGLLLHNRNIRVFSEFDSINYQIIIEYTIQLYHLGTEYLGICKLTI